MSIFECDPKTKISKILMVLCLFLLSVFVSFVVLGIEPRASFRQEKCPTDETVSRPCAFVVV